MTVIITGANRGLGFETTLALANNTNRTIILAGRDINRLNLAAEKVKSKTGNISLVPMRIDLGNLSSVRSFVSDFVSRKLPPLDSIICNAGISKQTIRERSQEGYEITFATNHLGHFLLVNLLLEHLQPPARILFVSSGVHDPAKIGGPMLPPRYTCAEWLAYPERDPDMPKKKNAAAGQAYANSKLCNVLLTYELVRRLESRRLTSEEKFITVNAFDPGLMAGTGLARDEKVTTRFMWFYVMPILSRFMSFGRTAAQSGADLAYLATDSKLVKVTAKYFSGREMIPSSEESYSLEKAADLWKTSVELTNLRPNESPLVF